MLFLISKFVLRALQLVLDIDLALQLYRSSEFESLRALIFKALEIESYSLHNFRN